MTARYVPTITFGNIIQLVAIGIQMIGLVIGGVWAIGQVNVEIASIKGDVKVLTEKVSRIDRNLSPHQWGDYTR